MLTGLFVLAAGATGPVAAADPLIRDADAGVSAVCVTGNADYEVVLTLGYSDRDGPAATIEVLDGDHMPVMGGYGTDSTWTADSFTGAVRLYSEPRALRADGGDDPMTVSSAPSPSPGATHRPANRAPSRSATAMATAGPTALWP